MRLTVPDLTSSQLPPPADWQEFERLCADLWREIWGDPDTQMHGRSGQPQHGIDIYGKPSRGDHYAGVQCKGKDERSGGHLSERELRAEVEKAKRFTPSIIHFVVATTAPSDAEIQRVAREISEAHQKGGLFSVDVYGWGEIQRRLAEHPRVLRKYYDGIYRTLREVYEGEARSDAHEGLAGIATELKAIRAQVDVLVSAPADASGLAAELQAELDHCRDLVRELRPAAALELLGKLRERVWKDTPSNVKFRIATNEAAAKLSLGRDREAADGFLAAYEYAKEDEKALCNRALAHLLKQEYPEAKAAALDASKRFPESSRARALLINARLSLDEELDPDGICPANISDSIDVHHALAQYARKRGDLDTALRHLRRARELDDNPDIGMALAETLAVSVERAGHFFPTAPLTLAEREALTEAATVLDAVWMRVSKGDTPRRFFDCPSNLVNILVVLGDEGRAEQVIDGVLRLASDEVTFIRLKANLLLYRGAYAETLRFLEFSAPAFEEKTAFVGVALRATGQAPQALALLKEDLERKPPSGSEPRLQVFLDTLREVEGLGAVRRYLDGSLMASPSQAELWIRAAEFANEADDRQGSLEALKRAEALVAGRNELILSLAIADVYFDLGEFEKAANLYRPLVGHSVEGRGLERFLLALIASEQRGEAFDVLSKLPESPTPRPAIERIKARLYWKAGEQEKARAHLDRYLEERPGDLHSQLLLAELHVELGESEKAKRILETRIAVEKLELVEYLHLIALQKRLGGIRDALASAYRVRKKFFREARAHFALMSLMLVDHDVPTDIGEQSEVRADSAVCLRDETGTTSEFVVETVGDTDLSKGEIPESHPIFRAMVGRRVGERVLIRKTELTEEYREIVWIKHKYLNALHDSLEHFETRFPDNHGLIRITTRGCGASFLQPVSASLDRVTERASQLKKLYSENNLPLCVVASLMGRNVLDVWYAFAADEEVRLRCCLGTIEELDKARGLIASVHDRIILEPVSLSALAAFKLLDKIKPVTGRLGIVRSAVDLLEEVVEDRRRVSKGFMSLTKQEGQLVRQEFSEADVQREIERLSEILKWVKSNCEVVPAIPKPSFRMPEGKLIAKLLGPVYLDTLLAANGGDRVLLTDDANLRELAAADFGVQGVWTQPLLMEGVERGAILKDDYLEAVWVLADCRYLFVFVNSDMMLSLARKESWEVEKFGRLAKALDAHTNDPRLLLRLLFEVLRDIWRDAPSGEIARAFTFHLLNGVNPVSTQHYPVVIPKLFQLVGLGRLPDDLGRALMDWCHGHFLPLPWAGGR